jgi:undecaprenyl-diphosphatase
MNILDALILGLIQGLTEFLPVSSSGHLIIARKFLGVPLENSLFFDIFLNTATLFAVVYCFFGDFKALYRDLRTEGFSRRSMHLIYALILGTIPAAIAGFFWADLIENTFREGLPVALFLIIGSIIMFSADRIKSKGGLTPLKGFGIGIFQALALLPGISRSGSTISGGIFAGLSREEAIRFSFLLLIPVSLGALLKVILDIDASGTSELLSFPHIAAFVAALLSGIWSVRFLVRYLSKNSFTAFIIYRLFLAAIIIIFL